MRSIPSRRDEPNYDEHYFKWLPIVKKWVVALTYVVAGP